MHMLKVAPRKYGHKVNKFYQLDGLLPLWQLMGPRCAHCKIHYKKLLMVLPATSKEYDLGPHGRLIRKLLHNTKKGLIRQIQYNVYQIAFLM